MTFQLIKMFIWGEGDVGNVATIEEDSVEVPSENDENSERDEDDDVSDISQNEVYPDYPHSRINFEFYSHMENQELYRTFVLALYGMFFTSVACITALPLYTWVLEMYEENSRTMTVYIVPVYYDSSRIVSYFPYIPSFLLSVSYLYPSMISTLNVHNNGDAILTRSVLWLQFWLQVFASYGDVFEQHIFEEISIVVGLTIVFLIFRLTSPEDTARLFNLTLFSTLILLVAIGYILYGLSCTIFLIVGIVMTLKPFLNNGFALITVDGRILLYSAIIPCIVMYGISIVFPSLTTLYNVLCSQLMGGVVDLILISPRPGKYLIGLEDEYDEEEEEE